ncbi:MAG: hypothetical protein M1308_09905 [Actinobacteria bacterium]|nr:hypothetical protein [Actinomycetota bacterium]
MKILTREESGWVLARVWLNALEETARDFFGNKPKIFSWRAYEHATQTWLRILEMDYGLKVKKAKTIKEAVENYIDIGVKGGLFQDNSQFELTEIIPSRLKVNILNCQYYNSCRDLIAEGVPVSNLTCARIGCFNSAVKLLSNIECIYEIDSVNEEGCIGVIENI